MADTVTRITSYTMDQSDTSYTYRAEYLIDLATTGPTDDPNTALTAAEATLSFPLRMSSFPTNAASYARDFSARPLDTKSRVTDKWIASVTWRPLDQGQKPGDSAANPTSRPTKLRLEYMELQEEIKELYNVTAFTGRLTPTLAPITDTAKQAPQEKYMATVRVPVVVATKNYSTQNAVDTLNTTYQNTVNNNTFFGRAAHYCKFLSADVTEEVREFGYTYYVATIRVALGYKPWYFELDNTGYRIWTGANCTGQLINTNDDNGHPEPGPAKIALDGTRAAKNSEIIKVQYRFPEANYTSIGIGTAFP